MEMVAFIIRAVRSTIVIHHFPLQETPYLIDTARTAIEIQSGMNSGPRSVCGRIPYIRFVMIRNDRNVQPTCTNRREGDRERQRQRGNGQKQSN